MSVKSALVKDYMSGKLVTFTPEMDVLDAMHELVSHRIAGAPVVDHHGHLVGMLSEFDCLRTVMMAAYHGERGGPGYGEKHRVRRLGQVAYRREAGHAVEIAALRVDAPHRAVEQARALRRAKGGIGAADEGNVPGSQQSLEAGSGRSHQDS